MSFVFGWEKGVITCKCGGCVFTGSTHSYPNGVLEVKLFCKRCNKELTEETAGSSDIGALN